MDQEFEYINLGHLQEEIFKLEDSIPDKRTKDYFVWKEKINYLYTLYNKNSGFKAFKLL